tara:strand:- start:590 stop:808 length:219 start_codon:yes stop_codon:yes gene_type:complete
MEILPTMTVVAGLLMDEASLKVYKEILLMNYCYQCQRYTKSENIKTIKRRDVNGILKPRNICFSCIEKKKRQ